MLPLILVLFLISSFAAGLGWLRVAKLNQRLLHNKKRYADLDSQRLFLVSQTTQLAEENAQLKARLISVGVLDVQTLQKNRTESAPRMGT